MDLEQQQYQKACRTSPEVAVEYPSKYPEYNDFGIKFTLPMIEHFPATPANTSLSPGTKLR
jgi:hypothetical protein